MAETPCSWTVDPTAVCAAWAGFTDGEKDYALRFATYVVWAATGRQFGLCPITVRPCNPRQEPLYLAFPVVPSWGLWVSSDAAISTATAPIGCCAGSCACTPRAITLPGPVGSITAVTIDGVVVDPGDYRTVGNRLIRQDGLDWPSTQDLSAPDGADNTWSVAYLRGIAPPPAVLDAAAVYACEVARARAGGNCFLPNRVQSVTRQGVEIQFVDQADYLDNGLTGVAEVDQLITALNPYKLKSRPRVLSPDLPTFL